MLEKFWCGLEDFRVSRYMSGRDVARAAGFMPDQYNYIDFRQLSSLHDKYPQANSALIRHLESDWEPVTELIEKGIREGVIRNISIPLLRIMFTASIEAFLSTDTLVRENIPYNEALAGMMDIIMRGIREDAHV